MLELTIKNKRINFIGDPHLGKNFGGVPLHRRGEREASQFKQFSDELNSDHDITIMVGDLFDTFTVSNDVLLQTMSIILEASVANPNKKFIFISGNHDVSRDRNVRGSFEILDFYCCTLGNVMCYTSTFHRVVDDLNILLCPYSEFSSAAEEVSKFSKEKFDLVVGHWDTLEIAGTHNLLPIKQLKNITDTVVSGHIHIPYTVKEDNITVYGTGSMQPYSHAEDPAGDLYVTKTVQQIELALLEDPNAFSNKCLRVVIEKGEVVPENINCLQFAVKVVSVSEKEDMEVTLGEFNFDELFRETFKENEVSEELTEHYLELYKQESTDA